MPAAPVAPSAPAAALDSDQAAAVAASLERPLLVVAGPGAGKTRVLTQRIIRLVGDHEAPPAAVVAITFTNAAAAEMAGRVQAGLADGDAGVRISTIHSLAAQIVRAHPEVIGLSSGFSIFDREDQLRIARGALERTEVETEAGELVRRIGTAKANLEDSALWAVRGEPEMARAFDSYEEELRAANALDFEGLVGAAAVILSRSSIVEGWRAGIRALLVDEFHDVSEAQFALVRLLCPTGEGLTAVADDDQIIYGFRGADPEFTVAFERYFTGARVVVLRRNYRCAAEILGSALAVIEHNSNRRPKDLRAARPGGAEPSYFRYEDEQAEAEGIAGWVERQLALGRRPGEIAVLVRMRQMTVRSEVEVALAARGIRYVTLGQRALWERPEVRDALAWLHLLVNPAHSPAFARALESRPGLGPASVAALEALARREKASFESACLKGEEAGLSANRSEAAAAFAESMGEIRHLALEGEGSFSGRVHRILVLSGIPGQLKGKGSWGHSRLESLRQIVRAARAYERRCAAEGLAPRLGLFLQELSLHGEEDPDASDAVSLATVHAVKGLEFACVWLAGMSEGAMPSARAQQEGRIEEERRLCYVAFTRAEHELVLSSSARRWGREAQRSRFLAEAGL